MKRKMIRRWFLLLAVGMSLGLHASGAEAQGRGAPEKLIRFVWQDREDKSLNWGELVQSGRNLVLQKKGKVEGFPELDRERHELVQMERINNLLLVGVRDDDKGKFLSGWAAIDLRVDEIPHGDHSDYNYGPPPRVINKQLDDQQGNPAHLYVYDRNFYLANDALNGFTRLTPQQLTSSGSENKGTFHRGGGGHITLAAVDNKVSYSTWIFSKEGEGGPVDVSDLSKTGEESLAYSFKTPTGGLHGAIANSGKIFLAPTDGVYWIDADVKLEKNADSVKINHLSLGEDEKTGRPHRTGAFTNHRNWVLFTTGKGESSRFCLVNASASEPQVVNLPIPVGDGLSLTTPEVVQTAQGKHYAFVFHNKQDGDAEEKLTVIDLDPNRDRDFSDARIAKTLAVGASKVEGHYGHHTIAFDDDSRLGLVTNPGNGEIWLLSLRNLNFVARYRVGGMPTKIIAIGGEESKH